MDFSEFECRCINTFFPISSASVRHVSLLLLLVLLLRIELPERRVQGSILANLAILATSFVLTARWLKRKKTHQVVLLAPHLLLRPDGLSGNDGAVFIAASRCIKSFNASDAHLI